MYAQFHRQFGVDQATHTVQNTPLWFGLFLKIVVSLVIIIVIYYATVNLWRLRGIETTMGVHVSMTTAVIYLLHEYVFILAAARDSGCSPKMRFVVILPLLVALNIAYVTIAVVSSIQERKDSARESRLSELAQANMKMKRDLEKNFEQSAQYKNSQYNTLQSGLQGHISSATNAVARRRADFASLANRIKQGEQRVKSTVHEKQAEVKEIEKTFKSTVGVIGNQAILAGQATLVIASKLEDILDSLPV